MRKCCVAAWYGRATRWWWSREAYLVKCEAQGKKSRLILFARCEIRFTNDEGRK